MGPQLEEGYLPIVSFEYEQDGERYGLRALAAVAENLASSGCDLRSAPFSPRDRGKIELRIESGSDYLSERNGLVVNVAGKALLSHDQNWEFNKRVRR